MKKFSNILENYMKKNLVKVRIKVDPANVKQGSIAKYNGYEGYILAEEPEGTKVCLEQDGVIMTFPVGSAQPCECELPKVERFKLISIAYLCENYSVNKDDPILAVILSAKTVEAIEQFIIVDGYNQEDILNIYKQVLAEYE